MEITPGPVPLTARELQMMHGLTVEQGLRQGYCIEGYVKEYREAHKVAVIQERKALPTPVHSSPGLQEIGLRVMILLDRQNKTQKQIADEAGTSVGTISRIINGTQNISLLLAARVADALGVSLDWLVYGDEHK